MKNLVIALTAALAVAGIAAGTAFALGAFDSGPSAEEIEAKAAAAEAAEEKAAQQAGDSCNALTEDAFDVAQEIEAQLDSDGYVESDYAEKVADINFEANSIEYFNDPDCENEVGNALEEVAVAHSDAQAHWDQNIKLQADWVEASLALTKAESGLKSIYAGN